MSLCHFVVPSLSLLLAGNAHAAAYVWHSVTAGGGGFAPDVIFSPVQKGLVYLRTDIGGVYRWEDKKQTWLPLQDAMAEGNYFGVESIAADPVDAKTVYAAVGMYSDGPAAMLRSQDRGDHWDIVPVKFAMGGNEP